MAFCGINYNISLKDSILKSRDITLTTKVRLVKAMVFQWSCMDVRGGFYFIDNLKETAFEILNFLYCFSIFYFTDFPSFS